jgi:membrane associated rhomboid family serine protease
MMSTSLAFIFPVLIPVGTSAPVYRVPVATWALIGLNVLFYILTLISPDTIVDLFGLHVQARPWQYVSYAFIHGSWPVLETSWLTRLISILHLATNLLMIWIFGAGLENRTSWWRLILLYVLCSIAGGLTHQEFFRNPGPPLIGASAAVLGFIGAYMIIFPMGTVKCIMAWMALIIFPLWVKTIHITVIFFLLICLFLWLLIKLVILNLWVILDTSSISTSSHLGGLLGGAALAAVFYGFTGFKESATATATSALLLKQKLSRVLEADSLGGSDAPANRTIHPLQHGDKYRVDSHLVDLHRVVTKLRDEESVGAYRSALKEDPDACLPPLIQMDLYRQMLRVGDRGLAIHVLERLLARYPEDGIAEMAKLELGRQLVETGGDAQKAGNMLKSFLDNRPVMDLELEARKLLEQLSGSSGSTGDGDLVDRPGHDSTTQLFNHGITDDIQAIDLNGPVESHDLNRVSGPDETGYLSGHLVNNYGATAPFDKQAKMDMTPDKKRTGRNKQSDPSIGLTEDQAGIGHSDSAPGQSDPYSMDIPLIGRPANTDEVLEQAGEMFGSPDDTNQFEAKLGGPKGSDPAIVFPDKPETSTLGPIVFETGGSASPDAKDPCEMVIEKSDGMGKDDKPAPGRKRDRDDPGGSVIQFENAARNEAGADQSGVDSPNAVVDALNRVPDDSIIEDRSGLVSQQLDPEDFKNGITHSGIPVRKKSNRRVLIPELIQGETAKYTVILAPGKPVDISIILSVMGTRLGMSPDGTHHAVLRRRGILAESLTWSEADELTSQLSSYGQATAIILEDHRILFGQSHDVIQYSEQLGSGRFVTEREIFPCLWGQGMLIAAGRIILAPAAPPRSVFDLYFEEPPRHIRVWENIYNFKRDDQKSLHDQFRELVSHLCDRMPSAQHARSVDEWLNKNTDSPPIRFYSEIEYENYLKWHVMAYNGSMKIIEESS